MALRLRGLASIGVPRGYDLAGPHCAPMCRRRLLALLVAAVLGGVGAGVLVERRARAPAATRAPDHHDTERAGDPAAPTGRLDVFQLSSPSFADGAEIPARFTCRGRVAVTGPGVDGHARSMPPRSRSSCATSTPAGFVHWIVTGIDPFVQGVGEGGLPENAVEGRTARAPPAGSPRAPRRAAACTPTRSPSSLSSTSSTCRSTRPPSRPPTTLETAAVERAVLTGTVAEGVLRCIPASGCASSPRRRGRCSRTVSTPATGAQTLALQQEQIGARLRTDRIDVTQAEADAVALTLRRLAEQVSDHASAQPDPEPSVEMARILGEIAQTLR